MVGEERMRWLCKSSISRGGREIDDDDDGEEEEEEEGIKREEGVGEGEEVD